MSISPWEIEQKCLWNLLTSVTSNSEDDDALTTYDNFQKDNEHFVELSRCNSESQQEFEEIFEHGNNTQIQSNTSYYLVKDKITKLNKKKCKPFIGTRFYNIIIYLPNIVIYILFGFRHKVHMTLVFYCKKNKKNVISLHTMNYNDGIII